MRTGIITALVGPYWQVTVDDNGEIMNLLSSQFEDRTASPIEIGQDVTLEYKTTAVSGLWYARRPTNG